MLVGSGKAQKRKTGAANAAPNIYAAESARIFIARVAKLEAMKCPCCKTYLLKVVSETALQRTLFSHCVPNSTSVKELKAALNFAGNSRKARRLWGGS